MVTVELIYDSDCPNVELTRSQLRQALAEVGLDQQWQEWDRADPASPDYVRRYGSPTVLVDGNDITGASEDACRSCRLYLDEQGKFSGVPPVSAISLSILNAREKNLQQTGHRSRHKAGWRRMWALLPSVGTVMIPGISCPACWPAYTGLLGSLGLGFVNYTPYLLPLTVLFLMIAVGALAFRAQKRRGYGPILLGLAAAAIMITGKFALGRQLVTYGGIGLLVAASAWNSWPRKTQSGVSCSPWAPKNVAKNK